MDDDLFKQVYFASRVARTLSVPASFGGLEVNTERLGFPAAWYRCEIFRITDYLYKHSLSPMPMLKIHQLKMTFTDFIHCFDSDETRELFSVLRNNDLPAFEFCPGEDAVYFAVGLGGDDMETAACLRFFEQKVREVIVKSLEMDDLIIWKNMLRISDELFEKNIALFIARICIQI